METFGIVVRGNRTEITVDADSEEEAKVLLTKIAQPLLNKFNIDTFTINKSQPTKSDMPQNLDTI